MFKAEDQYLSVLKPGIKDYTEWSSPSNIALVKYWGKRPGQEPENPSLSFSLNESRTFTRVDYETKKDKALSWNFLFENKDSPSFEPKLRQFFQAVAPYIPFLYYLDLKISSSNTFPHSAGIASSASAMSALALCLVDIEMRILNSEIRGTDFFKKASFLARLGSGSASRSVYPAFSVWGETGKLPGSSDTFAVPVELPGDSFFNGLRDAILIVSSDKKEVSSTAGHGMMKNNPYSDVRYRTAHQNLSSLLNAISGTDESEFIHITEREALSLHGLMMTSDPGFILMKGGSIEIIQRIRKFRKETGIFITFTLDAGPNVHLLYHENDHESIKQFILKELRPFTEKHRIIWDRIGEGPRKSSSIL